MRLLVVTACVAAVTAGSVIGCSSEHQQAPPPAIASPPPSHVLTVQERARDLILAAELELRDLNEMKSRTTDDEQRDAIDRQMASITMRRDALEADLAMTSGSQDGQRLHADTSNLERSLRAGAAAESQPPSPPPQRQQPPQPPQEEPAPFPYSNP